MNIEDINLALVIEELSKLDSIQQEFYLNNNYGNCANKLFEILFDLKIIDFYFEQKDEYVCVHKLSKRTYL